MRLSVLIVATVGTLAVVAVAALVFGLSLERAALLAPAIVICVGGAIGLCRPLGEGRAGALAPAAVQRPTRLVA